MKLYRFLVPFLCEIEVNAMDNEESIDYDKKVVGIPEGIETSKSFEGFG